MKLTWIGHACFRLVSEAGTVVVTDPYDESVGIQMMEIKADLVTMSHGHHDHCETAMLTGSPVIVRGLEMASVGNVTTTAVASYHDDQQGVKRGPNAIRLIQMDGLKIVHMGDQGCMPSEDVLTAIADADVMMIPTGGFYTINAQEAKMLIARAKPRCVIPMHVKTKHCGYPIDSVQVFLTAMQEENAQAQGELIVNKDRIPQGVVLMRPMADEL